MQSLSLAQIGVFEELTELVDDDPLLFLQYANAAETAQDYESAIGAYEAYLELQPNSPNAEQIEERIDTLRAVSDVNPAPRPRVADEADGEQTVRHTPDPRRKGP